MTQVFSRLPATWTIAAASLLLIAIPAIAAADPPHVQFGARSPHQGGALRLANGPPERDSHGGGEERDGDGHGRGWRGGDRGNSHDREWHGEGDRGDRDGEHWERPDWDDGGWRGEDWDGGQWEGGFWPRVYYGWNYPWFLPVVPAGAVTFWFGGVPYYYVNRVYYIWSPAYEGYVVADPPPVAQSSPAAAPPTSAGSAGDSRGAMSLFVYPKNGQTEQQTQNDRYQCHEWAVGQTGFDPTNSANDTQTSTATPESYKRALTACLEARGYSVR
jgi:hypothetical protein